MDEGCFVVILNIVFVVLVFGGGGKLADFSCLFTLFFLSIVVCTYNGS